MTGRFARNGPFEAAIALDETCWTYGPFGVGGDPPSSDLRLRARRAARRDGGDMSTSSSAAFNATGQRVKRLETGEMFDEFA